MAKFHGVIGFGSTVETAPGVYEEQIIEKVYTGDVLKIGRRFENADLNDNIRINNQISIIANPFAFQNCSFIRYVVWVGVKWKVASIEVEYPRLILTLGDVYNEQPT